MALGSDFVDWVKPETLCREPLWLMRSAETSRDIIVFDFDFHHILDGRRTAGIAKWPEYAVEWECR